MRRCLSAQRAQEVQSVPTFRTSVDKTDAGRVTGFGPGRLHRPPRWETCEEGESRMTLRSDRQGPPSWFDVHLDWTEADGIDRGSGG